MSIRFVRAKGWTINHTAWDPKLWPSPGFTAIIDPPGTGYGQLNCEALDKRGVQIGAALTNWGSAHGPVAKDVGFELIGEPVKVICRVKSDL